MSRKTKILLLISGGLAIISLVFSIVINFNVIRDRIFGKNDLVEYFDVINSKLPMSEDRTVPIPQKPICEDLCGNGICEEIVCLGEGCPCAETSESCSEDCGEFVIKNPPEETEMPKFYLVENVPFTPQAPFAEWDEIRFQEGCEEASLVMSWYWITGEVLTQEIARKEILDLTIFEENFYGDFFDTSAEDTLDIFKRYFGYKNANTVFSFGIEDIKKELVKDNLVLVPLDGTLLNHPYYTPPGPTRHMLVIRGFDDETGEFITNDPGTKFGKEFRFKYDILMNAIINYGTGRYEPLIDNRNVMIIIDK